MSRRQQQNQRQQQMQQQMAADQLMDPTQGVIQGRTHLLQIYADDIEEGPRMISEGQERQGIPIMVIMKSHPSCCTCKLNVPEGMLVLEQNWGAHSRLMEPGCYCCYPFYNTIPAMLTLNTIRFKCPVQQVPTKDNVMVSLDVGINFHIGISEESYEQDAKKFFYNFGPNRLEELLQEECDEGIRDFVKKIKVSRIRDVKTELTHELLDSLITKFKCYGVVIEQVNIMKVIVPRDLRIALMATTNFDVWLQKQVKEQYYKVLKLTNDENKQILSLKRNLMQELFRLTHDKDVEEINLLTEEVNMETDQIKKEIQAMTKQSSMLIDANNQLTLAKLHADAQAKKSALDAEAHETEVKILGDTEASIIKSNGEARLACAESNSKALIKEANAESAQSNNMEGERRHQEKLGMQDALTNLAQHGKMVVSGASGQAALNFFNKAFETVSKR